MLSVKLNHFKEQYNDIVLKEDTVQWQLSDPIFFFNGKQCSRRPDPYIGIINDAVKYSHMYKSFTSKFSFSPTDLPQCTFECYKLNSYEVPAIEKQLESVLRQLLQRGSENRASHEYVVSQEAALTFKLSMTHVELKEFLSNLSAFLKGHYKDTAVFLEPFQKQLILHSFLFIASIKCPESLIKLLQEVKVIFDMTYVSDDSLKVFQQKSPVFLIPRRHGKTWIVTAIISMMLASIDNIHIGYVAHQKHVSLSVFMEISNILLKLFPQNNIDIKKENGVIIFTRPGRRPSTLMCATCFNKNVSISVLFFYTILHQCVNANLNASLDSKLWNLQK